MTAIVQEPTELDLSGIGGSPFSIQINLTATDSSGNSISSSQLTSPYVTVTNAVRPTTGVQPTVTTPASGEVLIAWSATQTELLEEMAGTQWCLWITIEGVGPSPLLAGDLTMTTPTSAGY